MAKTTIYFASNRRPNNKSKPTGFGKGFSRTGLGDVRFGQASVVNGNLDKNSIKVLPDNPENGSLALFDSLQKKMKLDQADSLLFIHGFNVSFEDAIESAAKMAEQYAGFKYKPNMFVFSWPSDGKVTNYFNDRHDAEASGYAFARGLMKLSGFLKSCSKKDLCYHKVHLMAHSMGNYVLRHALQQALKIADAESLSRLFDEIILTAADEDNDAFEFDYKLARLPDLAQRITVYFNYGDLALKTSDFTKGNPDRLGHDGPNKPHDIPGKVVLVDASPAVDGIAEHSYHQEEPDVMQDIVKVLQGHSSEDMGRIFVPHANKFKLVETTIS